MPMGMMIWSLPIRSVSIRCRQTLTIMEWCLACMGGRILERLQRSALTLAIGLDNWNNFGTNLLSAGDVDTDGVPIFGFPVAMDCTCLTAAPSVHSRRLS